MINIIWYFFSFLVLIILINCSFDKKSGIWSGYEKELKRVAQLEKDHESEGRTIKIFSTSSVFVKEIPFTKTVNLTVPKKNIEWPMSGLNLQNSSGNLYLEGIQNRFLKKKIGKDKFEIFQRMHSPLFYENNIVLSDDKGSVFRINKEGKIYWKTNIYRKIYKKLYKKLSFSIYKSNIYVADNIGFIYSLDYKSGRVIWKKNFGIPFKSYIKVFNEKIFIIDQDNRVMSLDVKNGSKIWDIRTVQTFIKSQNFLGLAVSQKGNLIVINSAGDVLKVNSNNGRIFWSMSSLVSLSTYDTDFFKSSDIVINKEDVIFSSSSLTFSIKLANGYLNWKSNISSSSSPIVDGNNVFLVTDEGYFVNFDRVTGKVIWITDILKVLKKKKRLTMISGFVMGSNKIYATTLNGYLIVCSATSGNVESFKKISSSINTSPIISNGELYVLTSGSKILGFK